MTSKAVLRQGVTRDELDDVAARCGWQLTNVLPATPGRPPQLIFAGADGRCFVYVVEELRLGVTYLMASGSDADVLLAQASAELPCHAGSDGDAGAEVATELAKPTPEHAQIARGLGIMVLQAAGPDEAVAETLRLALTHGDPTVRLTALTATTYATWPSLRASVETIAMSDPVEQLKLGAGQLLAAWPSQEAS